MMRRNVMDMNWEDFLDEFKKQFCDQMAMRDQHNEFNDLKQGDMTITKACRKFDWLARLCSELVPIETLRIWNMIKMFRLEITLIVDSRGQPPSTVFEYVSRVLWAKYHLAQSKADRAKYWEAKKKEKTQNK